jgi:hypothetical protein
LKGKDQSQKSQNPNSKYQGTPNQLINQSNISWQRAIGNWQKIHQPSEYQLAKGSWQLAKKPHNY